MNAPRADALVGNHELAAWQQGDRPMNIILSESTKPKGSLQQIIFSVLLLLPLIFFAPPLWADCPHKGNYNHKHCDDDPDGNTDEKSFPAKVIFDDFPGTTDPVVLPDTIMTGLGAPFIGGVAGMVAVVPREGTPPGQFLMYQLNRGSIGSLFYDFGPAFYCVEFGTLGCVLDDSASPALVQCPFKLGERRRDDFNTLNDSFCSGFKGSQVRFRHVVGDPDIFMLGMSNTGTYDGEAYGSEFAFPGDKNVEWRLHFDKSCDPAGDFLEINANDHDRDDNLFNDEWHIGTRDSATGSGMKTACLFKAGKGHVNNFIGLFDMQFGYTVCILADPDSGGGCIL
jgi:hypothetical protein